MTRLFFALLFIILGPSAWAQMGPTDPPVNIGGTRCNPVGPDAAARDAGIGPRMSGMWMMWWCKTAKGQWWLQVNVVAASDLTSWPGMMHDWTTSLNGTFVEYDKAITDLKTKYPTQIGDPYDPKYKPIWYPALPAMLAVKPADIVVDPPPTSDVWRTPKASTAATYTMYNTANGKLVSVISGKKATPDALCSCTTTKVMSGTSTYCALNGAPSAEVTLCKKVVP